MPDIIIAGVGGQGIILASRSLGAAALAAGLPVRTAETIGMAQREGSVTSHVRLGKKDIGPLIPVGKAEVLIALEPAEACRNLHYLHKDGLALINTSPVIPVMAALGHTPYPIENILSFLKEHIRRSYFVDASSLAVNAGSTRTVNMVMLGALSSLYRLPFSADALVAEALKALPDKVHEMNRLAFELGRQSFEEVQK